MNTVDLGSKPPVTLQYCIGSILRKRRVGASVWLDVKAKTRTFHLPVTSKTSGALGAPAPISLYSD